MKKITEQVLGEMNQIFNYDFSSDNKELIMALFMQIFSYKYDDNIDDSIRFKDIQNIVRTVWVPVEHKTNDLVGRPIFLDNEEQSKFMSLDLNNKTMYILNEIRGSFVHGAFRINEDGTITITDKDFQMTFEFDCIIDICLIIVRELDIRDNKIKELYDFTCFIQGIKNNTDDYNKARIDYSYLDLRYPIILFNLLPMNEDDFHNDRDYSDFIVSLFTNREFYKNGRFKSREDLKVTELAKLRNCIAHGQYYLSRDDLILFDHKNTFVFDTNKLNEIFGTDKKTLR